MGIAAPNLESIRQNQIEGISIRLIKDVPYLFGKLRQEGRATAAILSEQLPQLILGIEFPKKMRWGTSEISYARPLRWIVALFGKDLIPVNIDRIQSSNMTYGHRQLAPQARILLKAQDYVQTLREISVLVDPEERENLIIQSLNQLEKEEGIKILEREKVLSQVVNLVEYPHLTLSEFKPEFLKIPKEVLISVMVEHQKYFPVGNLDGSIRNLFVITANVVPTNQIRQGNQRVISARFADGAFLYEEDLKSQLLLFNEKLKKMTFQKELGTVYEKVERIESHAKVLQRMLKISTPEKAERAALLCKADLSSGMVYEFPELQGIIGRYYAKAGGEDSEVALAIDEHWMPRGENAPLPESETGIIVSLADKIDNLLGCFSVGLKPTSSGDPYALRRQVLGLIKILIKNEYEISLRECLTQCAGHFPSAIMKNRQEVVEEILNFITNRIKTVFQEYGFQKDEIEASLSHGSDDIFDTFCRVQALHEFRKQAQPQFHSLYEVYKRAKGQLNGHVHPRIDEKLLVESAEKKLYDLLDRQLPEFQTALKLRNYNEAYSLIATIQPALADLFNQVKILADEPAIRENRLALLKRVFNLFGEMLDFSKIQEK